MVAAETDELLAPSVTEARQIAGAGTVFPTAERGLRPRGASPSFSSATICNSGSWNRRSASLVSSQPGNLIETLPQQGQRVMPHPVLLSRIAEESGPIVAQMMTLIEGSQW